MATPVAAYLAAVPDDQREALARLRALLLDAVPEAEEAIKTRVPAVCHRGKIVAGYGAAKHHVALYVMRGDALTALRADLTGYDASTRVVRFTPAEPLPDALVRKIVRYRLEEIDRQLSRRGSSRVGGRS